MAYDPTNIQQYYGKTFVTRSSRYRITEDGRFSGRPSIEGARIDLIAGVGPVEERRIKNPGGISKERLDSLIMEHGVEPSKGLYLAISLAAEDAKEKNRTGLVTSLIKDII